MVFCLINTLLMIILQCSPFYLKGEIMKKLLLTTAVLTLSTFGSAVFANAGEANTLSSTDFATIMEAVNTTSSAVGLHTGDFQVIARSVNSPHLYDGMSSAMMKTVMAFRY